MNAIRVTITEARGSTPREAGTAMLVFADHIEGTIGGGALEWEAMAHARAMLADGTTDARRVFPLGPALGQCCGGAVTLHFHRATPSPETEKRSIWIWGAGHVGRALVHSLSPLQDLGITWVDTAPDRFPQDIPSTVHSLPTADMPRLMPHAPAQAHHLIVTYSHDIDLALCHAALSHGFASCGLIGSATKWARFRTRLRQLGHSDAQISRITCPIGDPSLGKHPQAIAIGVAARLLVEQMPQESARQPEMRAQSSGGT
jgi:xanthine dehydrogenase accessory factor